MAHSHWTKEEVKAKVSFDVCSFSLIFLTCATTFARCEIALSHELPDEILRDFVHILIPMKHLSISGVKKAMGPDPPSFRLNDLGVEIHRKTLGIVGMGSIGLRLAKRAKAFDMQILYHNRNRRYLRR